MTKYKILPITTKYWKPRNNFLEEIIKNLNGKILDHDFVTISEKATSTASHNIIDESQIKPTTSAKLIAEFWMPMVWGYLLGPLCRLNRKLLTQIRAYPAEAGSRHKQVALTYGGTLQALMFGSEGGIDGSNLPYSYVSLPLRKPQKTAETIRKRVLERLGKRVFVMIVDTDKTYSFRNFHFTPRPNPLKGIHSFGGVFTYVMGRFPKLHRRATPLAVAGCKLSAETALTIADIANRARGFGSGRTVWDMAENFRVGFTEVTWEMLETVKHKPIAILRSKR